MSVFFFYVLLYEVVAGRNRAMANTDPPKSIRVFVSYSHDSRQHADRVLAFCQRLRKEGIDVKLDQYEPAPSERWPLWMMRQIEKADFVVLICTETYLRRFKGEEEPGRGQGVGWESAIITQELYEAAGANEKFIPVTFSKEDEAHIPIILAGFTRYRLDRQKDYEALCHRLTQQPPKVGEIRQVSPRRRGSGEEPSAGDSSALRRERGKFVLPLVCLGILISIAVAGAIMLWPPVESPELERRMVPLKSRLASTNSVTWSPDDSALVIVGKMTKDIPMKLLRYSLEGELTGEIPVNQAPLTTQRVGERLLVQHENVFVWYDKFLRQIHPYQDLLAQSRDGRDIRPYQWELVGSNLYVLGDIPIEVESPGSEDGTEQKPPWERGVAHVPVDSTADFAVVQPLATDGRLSWLYRLGYPHLASVDDVDDRVYLLEMKDDLKIVRLSRQARRRSDFPLHLKGFDRTPDFTQLGGLAEAYSLFESSAIVAGLYRWKNSLYVLSKCPTSKDETTSREETTRWFLTRIDPRNGIPLYTLSLPTAAPHLILAPGDYAWVILEQERFEAVDRNQGNRDTSAFVLVPSREIDKAESPLVVDDSLSLCSCPARWNEEPPYWDYPSGARPWR